MCPALTVSQLLVSNAPAMTVNYLVSNTPVLTVSQLLVSNAPAMTVNY